MSWRGWYTPLIFLALALAWTWPAALADGEVLVGRHFDTPASLWFLGSSERLLTSLSDPLTAWPEGARYGRPDSFTALALGWLLRGLHPARIYGVGQVLGVAATAWAAEGFARAAGARAPWSLLAGLAAGFCGLASTALLEGYVYHVMAPWLPLFAWQWWRATGAEGRTRHGALAGLFFLLTLLSTAYLGVAAALLALGFAAGSLARGTVRWRAWAAAAAVALPAGLVYVAAFVGAEAAEGSERAEQLWRLTAAEASANLLSMGGPSASQDLFSHSLSSSTPAVALCLALAAPVALRGQRGWRTLAATGFGALLLSMGPTLGSPGHPIAPLPLALVEWLPGRGLLRFPARLGWTWVICGGALAARVATAIGPRAGRPALALLAFALVDLFAVERLPLRQRTQAGGTPSAYGAHRGAVLDLFPEALGRGYELEAWFQARACYYQLGHGRPIANNCVVTRPEADPARAKTAALTPLLLAGDSGGAAALLEGWRFATVALHPDLFPPGDRGRIMATLAALDPAPVSSTDGGDHVVAYRVGR